MIEVMDQLSPAVMDSFVHVAVSDSVSTISKPDSVPRNDRSDVFLLNSTPFSTSVHAAPQPPRRPPVVGGVDRPAGEQLVRREEPEPRLDLRAVREGPLGAVSAHLPAPGAPTQTLLHRSGLRLALRLHTATAAAAPGGPQVQKKNYILKSRAE